MPSSTCPSKMHKCKERNTQAYWEARLKRMGLGLDSGHNRSVITYGHMVKDLDWDGKITYRPPTGEGLANEEWPISLL